jgi:hypothetical protein
MKYIKEDEWWNYATSRAQWSIPGREKHDSMPLK